MWRTYRGIWLGGTCCANVVIESNKQACAMAAAAGLFAV